ncbi:fibronectin type III domain-containing protein, partial [Arthrospira platensis SPKY2]
TAQATTKRVVDVTGLKLVNKDYKSLSFDWDNVAENYNIIANDINVNVTDTTYTLSDLNADTRYTFKVRAMQDNFVGEFATITETTESVPVPKMEAIPFENSIKVNLTDGTGQYEVKIDNDPYTLISGNTHEFKDLVADTEYIIYARSVYKGSYSQAITENVTTEMIAIDKPIVKQAWANRDSVTLVMENTSYQYSISVDDASAKTYGSTAVITGLNKGTSYKFTIKSLSDGNYSEPVEITRNTASGTEITNIGHIKLSKDTAKFFWTGSGQSFDVILDGSDERYTGSEQTCEFSGLEDGKDYRLMIIQNVDGKWSTWYYYNFRLEDETVISDDKPIEPTVDVEPPTNLRIKDVGETTANLIFEKS